MAYVEVEAEHFRVKLLKEFQELRAALDEKTWFRFNKNADSSLFCSFFYCGKALSVEVKRFFAAHAFKRSSGLSGNAACAKFLSQVDAPKRVIHAFGPQGRVLLDPGRMIGVAVSMVHEGIDVGYLEVAFSESRSDLSDARVGQMKRIGMRHVRHDFDSLIPYGGYDSHGFQQITSQKCI
jgi:hypothetical protein